MAFTFKQFHIFDDNCGMPVSTDGVLLGAWAPLIHAKRVLDIGAGSGLLSLMAAQRTQLQSQKQLEQSQITAIEIDAEATNSCQHNFDASPWFNRLNLFKGDIKQFAASFTQNTSSPSIKTHELFDHIICNPPYFETGLIAQNQARAQARHTHSLDFITLQSCIQQLLTPTGFASLILPTEEAKVFNALLNKNKLQLLHLTQVSTVEGKAPIRALLLIGHRDIEAKQYQCLLSQQTELTESLFIRNKQGLYSQAMINLTREFYLKM